MCGRTACTLAPDEVSRACLYRDRRGRRRQPRWRDGDQEKYRPSYNKSPQSMSPVLVSQRHFDEVSSAAINNAANKTYVFFTCGAPRCYSLTTCAVKRLEVKMQNRDSHGINKWSKANCTSGFRLQKNLIYWHIH